MGRIKFIFAVIILFGLFGFVTETNSLCATGELYAGFKRNADFLKLLTN